MWAQVGEEGSYLLSQRESSGSRWNSGALDSFLGSYDHLLDQKARLALPRPFKRIVGVKEDGREPHVVLAKGFDGCLYGFSEEMWPRFERTLREQTVSDEEARAFCREMADHLCPVPVDTVGRIVIPTSHLEIGKLKKGQEVKILGMVWYFEIWNPSVYSEYRKAKTSKGSYEERAKKLFMT
jgi:MraZ protein